MENVMKRFLRYVNYDSKSIDDCDKFPSTDGQTVLLSDIAEELKTIGLIDVSMDKYGYVFATLPSNIENDVPVIGFIAHVDTSPEITGSNIKPQIIEDYDGSDIILNSKLNITLSPNQYPDLMEYIGQTIITTDGTTLLGADDKAGVAEIITAMEYLIKHPEIKHGTVRVGFTPDEEVGRGVDFFDVSQFNASFAYTLDGGKLGEVEYENFNASKAIITINGINTHPGSAKNIMKNSILIATELSSMLPSNETPATTEGYQGFYHLDYFNGNIEKTIMKYIIRDFNIENLNKRKACITDICSELNKKYGEVTITLTIKDQYYNMLEKLKDNMHIVDMAIQSMKELDIKPVIIPIRGGTDGARLSYMGLPCPNLFTGGHNFHGKYEYIPVFSMEKSVNLILKILQNYAQI